MLEEVKVEPDPDLILKVLNDFQDRELISTLFVLNLKPFLCLEDYSRIKIGRVPSIE